jgi:hypothetical protein
MTSQRPISRAQLNIQRLWPLSIMAYRDFSQHFKITYQIFGVIIALN